MFTRDLFVDQLSKLVNCQTLPGNIEENAKALDLVESWIDKAAFVRRVKNGKAEILIAGNKETNEPDVAYLVHMDVVAGNPEQFEMHIDGDKLIGRGTSDMKFSVPMGISLLNEMLGNKKISFALVITTDEEVGGFEGTNHLVNMMKYKPKLLIVPDGGDNLTFVDRAKGVCQLFIEATGIPAHASRPWKGRNALADLVELGHMLLAKYGKNNLKEGWKTTMNIGVIQGGISVNQVCDKAVMKLDFRHPETVTEKEITDEVKDMANKIGDHFKITPGVNGLPTFVDVKETKVKYFLEIMSESMGQKIEVAPTHGASDARWFAKYKTPVLMIKPIGGEIHSENEWISLSSSLKFFEGLRKFVLSL